MDGALQFLRRQGVRITAPRRLLVEVLFAATLHHSADDLAAAVQAHDAGVSRSTIYRNLEEFERLGLVVHAHLGHGPATYHLAAHAHAHLVCERCSGTISLDPSAFDGLASQVRAQFGFALNPRHSALLGLCERCAAPSMT